VHSGLFYCYGFLALVFSTIIMNTIVQKVFIFPVIGFPAFGYARSLSRTYFLRILPADFLLVALSGQRFSALRSGGVFQR
jgi:hypothetical protein